jgi:hypothetical protein
MIALRPIASLLVLAATLSVGAASAVADNPPPGDIPDTQAFVKFSGPGYSLQTPEGWGRTRHGAVITLADKFNAISVEIQKSSSAPTVASVKQRDIPKLKATAKGFQLRTVTRLTRTAGPVVLVTYRAASAPDSVTGKTITEDVERYAFWKSGRLAIVTLQAPKGSDNVDAWKLVTNSFRWSK